LNSGLIHEVKRLTRKSYKFGGFWLVCLLRIRKFGIFGCKLDLFYPVLTKERSIAKNRVNGWSVLPERGDLKGEESVSLGKQL